MDSFTDERSVRHPAADRVLRVVPSMRNRCLLIVFLATFFALRAVAWGPTGHRVVAEIAQRHLKPPARERVARLLGGYSLAEVANWADDLRSEPRSDKSQPLHYATVPAGLKSY